MSFKIINEFNYDKIVSIGNRCITAITLSNAQIKQDTYTFDWTQSNPEIILDCIKTNFKKYNTFGNKRISKSYDMHKRYPLNYEKNFGRPNLKFTPSKFINEYGMCFTHYLENSEKEFVDICLRRSNRFIELLSSSKKILFVYINDENLNLQEKQYIYLLQLEQYLKEYYPKLNFKILTIQFIKKANTDHDQIEVI